MNEQTVPNDTARFVRALPVARHFTEAFDEAGHAGVPDDWVVAVTDVVRSRDQIAKGRYKAVNMAGVAMISAAMNELSSRDLPYVFGGDGAAMVLSPAEAQAFSPVLSRLVTMAEEELELELRAALVPVSRIRADGFDVRMRPVRVSDAITNYAFTGGGISHAEKLMKAGEYRVAKGAPGSRPDLTGLSCRWTPVSAEGRSIVSLIVERGEAATSDSFSDIIRQLLALLDMDGDGGSPIPPGGPNVRWPVAGADLEARATRGDRSLLAMRLQLFFTTLFAFFLFKTGIKVGEFNPAHYQSMTGLNTDFRKVQDGLRTTVSLAPHEQERLETFLELQRQKRLIRYGISVQDSALLTCYAPSVMEDGHIHFLDGAGGGYSAAASAMRA
ncbi:MAG TPA: DUF3095 family protein [Rhizobiaceae bacterium]|nr:DUF3095 family protein [Rhizobiaceae bacterium]